MANSVETRYPFLDEDVIALLARIHPRWKLRGLKQDKYLLRQMAARYLPPEIAARPKHMFRAPFATSLFRTPRPYVSQLMSPASLRSTGYFDVAEVRSAYESVRDGTVSKWRYFGSIGLVGVLATQLWHHLHLGGGLCELPTHEPPAAPDRSSSAVAV
jgi:asparagine synthase (glutamine-hydrolysing)